VTPHLAGGSKTFAIATFGPRNSHGAKLIHGAWFTHEMLDKRATMRGQFNPTKTPPR
jgi:hypothetical protein